MHGLIIFRFAVKHIKVDFLHPYILVKHFLSYMMDKGFLQWNQGKSSREVPKALYFLLFMLQESRIKNSADEIQARWEEGNHIQWIIRIDLE